MTWKNLSPELIFQILSKFRFTLDVAAPKYFPWYLGHICSSWRMVFKSSPQFWSSFVIGLDENCARRHLERALFLTEMCIRQSQTRPLTFQFRFTEERSFDLLDCHKLLKALMAQSTRWLNVNFYLPRHQASFLYAVKTQLPILRAFRVTYSDHRVNDAPQFGDIFEDASQVRRVHVINYQAWQLNWSSITTLHLELTSKEQPELLVEFLQTIQHLEELHLGRPYSNFISTEPTPRITLPSLKRLSIYTMDNFLLFETPMLEALYTATFSERSIEEYNGWMPNFLRQLHHLNKLVLLLTNTGMTVLVFHHLPHVRNIDFYVTDLSLLEILPLCPLAPHLETMTLGIVTSFGAGNLQSVLDKFKFWRRQSNAPTGFGRFEGLKRFTLKVEKASSKRTGYKQNDLDRFESNFTRLFSERGVQSSIDQVRSLQQHNAAVPPFDIFDD